MKAIARRIWDSPTASSWAAYLARSGSVLLVLPLVLRQFSAAEVAVWSLFAGLVTLSAQGDLGFRATFVRYIAYAAGGAKSIAESAQSFAGSPTPVVGANWELITRLVSLMRRVYRSTSAGVLVLLATVGTVSLWRPITAAGGHSQLWFAWAVVCVAVAIEFQGKVFKNYLEGLNHVAMVRRVETITRIAAILTCFAVMTLAPSVLNLVLAERAWAILNVGRDWMLARRVEQGRWIDFGILPFDRDLFRETWAPAWRSGIASLMSIGLTSITGLLYAQVGTSASVAAYLLATRLLTQLRSVSQAPFYSRLPLFSRQYAQGQRDQLVRSAKRSIDLSHAVFFLGAVVAGLAGPWFLARIGSETPWVPDELWWLMALAYFIHRVSGMHMQLYLTTNHVVAHLVDGASGLLFIAVSGLLLPRFGVYAFPIGMCAGYLMIHTPISFRLSRRLIGGTMQEFLRDFVLPQACIAAVFVWLLVLSLSRP